jgi:nucleoside transporter
MLIKSRLSVMMFLEFFIWGAWYATVSNYMAEIGMGKYIYWAFTVGPIGALISPFFLGMIADRFFPTERILGVLHLLGGIFILCAPFVWNNPVLFILFLGLHMLCFQPTLALVNTLSFHHIKSAEKEFPAIRMLGTVGWIVAGVLVSGILAADKTALPLFTAGIAAILMGIYSFTLPHTPPPAAGKKSTFREIAGIDALVKLSNRSFLIFLLSSMLICIPLSAYYAYAQTFLGATGFTKPAFSLTFGQMGEALLILLLPWFFRRLGVKWTLAIGMLGWVIRYSLFSIAAPMSVQWMIFIGILLHGICYDFFYVTGQIYVEEKATPEIRGQAQGLIVLVTYGIGMLIGAQIAGVFFNRIVTGSDSEKLLQYGQFWVLPAAFAGAVLLLFILSFNEKK